MWGRIFIISAAIACVSLASIGCDSSLIDGGGFVDGGVDDLELIDASDNRNIPFACTSSADCDDDDPCTIGNCVKNLCEYTTVELELNAATVATNSPALDVALGPGVAYVSLGKEGVGVYNISNPSSPAYVATAATSAPASGLDADERGFVVAEEDARAETFAAGSNEQQSQFNPGMDYAMEIGMGSRYTLVAGFMDGVSVMDLTNYADPVRITVLDTPGRAVNVVSPNETFALVADSLGGAFPVLFDTKEGVALGPEISTIGRVVDVDVRGETGLLAEFGAGLGVFDLSAPSLPVRLAQMRSKSPSIYCGLIGQQTAVIAEESGQIIVYSLINPFLPTQVASWEFGVLPTSLDVKDGLIAVAMGDAGFALISTSCSDL